MDSFRNNAASIRGDRTLVSPVVSWVSLCQEGINRSGRSSYKTVDNLVPEIDFAAELISTLRQSILLSKQCSIPEIFVLVAHADTVGIFAVKAEAKLLKGWQCVDARNFTVEDDMDVTFIAFVSSVLHIFFLEEAEWVLVFLNVDDEFLTVLQVGKKGRIINHAFAGKE